MSKIDPFVHLHVHTDHSLLDGHSTIDELTDEVARLGQPAVAITDHGSLGGIRKLWKSATAKGVKPIVGCEFYIAPASRMERTPIYWGRPEQRSEDVANQGSYCHITVISTGDEGVRNLFRLYATSYADGFYRKPRIDLDSLEAHSSGLVVTTGCAGGLVATRLRLGQYDKAQEVVATLRDVFDQNLYIEIMDHENPVDEQINGSLIQLSRELSVPLVATNDSHYTKVEDAYSHDALLCIQTQQRLNGVRSFRFEGSGYHLRSHEEMADLFREIPDAVSNSLVIAERVEEYREIFARKLRFPKYSEDAVHDLELQLSRHEWLDPVYDARELYEKEVIVNLGYADYFMVMADIAQMGKELGIRVGPGRGSGCGSLVAYKLGIHDVDPIEHGLLFERFLNPERISLPDIDVDVSDGRRDELLAAISRKYGADFVAQICTRGTIGAKAALHDSARVLGFPRRLSDGLTSRLPPAKFGRAAPLVEGAWNGLSDDESQALELARSLEGRIRNAGIHPSGIIISPEPLENIIPIMRSKEADSWVTGWDMDDIDAVGLVKMDYLGLKTLGVIDECMRMLTVRGKELPDLSTELTGLKDTKTFDLLRTGHTLGIFQLDSPGMQQMLRSIQPDRFADISAVLALYRPGPMGVNAHHSYAKRKTGKEGVSYPHRELEECLAGVLGSTYGLVVYQEQVLEILRIVGGYSYSSAELIFDAMRKKKTEKMLEAKPDFVRRMKDNGFSDECVDALWNTLLPFSDYSFNKSHTTGYGIVSYWTAYLKAHYPTEWMAAALTREDIKTLPEYIREVSRMGIDVLPPDINVSEGSWTPTDDGIRYGLSSIKNFGDKAFKYLIPKRPFNNLDDFFRRASLKTLNARTLGSLIRSGALDSICPDREELYAAAETLSGRAVVERRLANKGMLPLYSPAYSIPSTGSFNRTLRQQWERELLNTTLTQIQLTVVPNRWLEENEFYFLKNVVSEHPGRQRISLKLGYATISLGYVDWNDQLRRHIESLGVVDVVTE